ncbi:hypothetical protein [Glycomyces niveus]|nr:hypothetical protein [Glycomyces sp. NEAU-S30]
MVTPGAPAATPAGALGPVVGLGLNAVIMVLLASADSKEWCRD